jgi:Amt family ammonium transporter
MRRKVTAAIGLVALSVVALTAPAMAQEVEEPLAAESVQAVLDNIWILIAAVLVIFMQAGFALVEAGLTRAKSVANIMMKNLMDFVVGVLVFGAVGFAFAFGSGNDFIGTSGWFLDPSEFSEGWGNLSLPTFFIFQVAFAATAATIVSGAMAERTKFKAYFVYSAIISAIVYPIVVHWVWGGGWLANLDTPYHDFAGSGVVHMTGGVAALVGAASSGPASASTAPTASPGPSPATRSRSPSSAASSC